MITIPLRALFISRVIYGEDEKRLDLSSSILAIEK
jgi:hypothetical protein